ncbi:YopX family protein [Capnocytophaga canimorsus]|uniref:YopX family protein n=1 Tax=Capnocytophaga canimorsus TaxID=28188 RepID=UPI000F50989E|nr:YopX family protein [Capnocytophaga canimorsus]AYW36548.1 hypothetical protein D8L92_04005 [Capnocytophaga canimorsus]
MKREIKFRAQRKDNKWQYSMTLSTGKEIGGATKSYDYFMAEKGKGWVKVKAETIGQFTGLYDKNGNEIYEGDILAPISKESFYYVGFESGMFCIYNNLGRWATMERGIEIYKELNIDFEIIGNIYQNSELVK